MTKRSAKRASWTDVNPRAALVGIIQLNPDDEPKWRREFWAYVKTREPYLHSIVEDYIDHTIAELKGRADAPEKYRRKLHRVRLQLRRAIRKQLP
jgi:hypothetical protein